MLTPLISIEEGIETVVLNEDSVLSDVFLDGRRELHRLHLLTEFGFEYEPNSEKWMKIATCSTYPRRIHHKTDNSFWAIHVLEVVNSVSSILQIHYFVKNDEATNVLIPTSRLPGLRHNHKKAKYLKNKWEIRRKDATFTPL